jgi:uncharacterized protein
MDEDVFKPFPYPVVHLELHTAELAAAQAFYSELCGWRAECIQSSSGCYLSVELGARLGGGMVACPSERALWLPYVEVPQIDSATDRARGFGATVLLEPREGPAGWRSVVGTSAGGAVALWQQKRWT